MSRGWALVLVVAACSTNTAVPPPAPAPAPAPAAGNAVARTHELTLITGDRVTVDRRGTVSAVAGAGRAGVTFVQRTHAGHVTVIPSDALALVNAGTLDRRLFDVTALIEQRLDGRDAVPVIVTRATSLVASPLTSIAGMVPVRDLRAIGATAVRLPATVATWRSLAPAPGRLAPGLDKIWLDGKLRVSLDTSVPLVGAPAAWAHPDGPFDGTGITVAVLDTGVDVTHPDLASQVVGGFNFLAEDPFEPEDELDYNGHGTHVASTIAGTGAASGGAKRGVAPGARLLAGKVCDRYGYCSESAIIAGMQWAAESGAKIVNMSLGGPDSPGIDPQEAAVAALTAQYGVLFVIAAGNDGGTRTVGSPGSADDALTVAAFDRADQLADFSSRGPRVGDNAAKPDLAAPGVDISAARSAASELPGDQYTTLSGTSMATPHVAGAAAILLQRRPGATPAQLKSLLMASAVANPALVGFEQGAGRLDVARAIEQTITTTPASISCGAPLYPHGDDAPVATTVTYRNAGPAAVTLALAVHAAVSDHTPAPAGLFSLSASSVTVPAGGEAAVVVTCNTAVPALTGVAGGGVTATATGVRVETPFAVDIEHESYDVTLVSRDRAGLDPSAFETFLFPADAFQLFGLAFADAPTSTVRLRRGRYVGMSFITDAAPGADGVTGRTLLYYPPFELTANRTIEFAAIAGKPVALTVARPNARLAAGSIEAWYFPVSVGGTGETIHFDGSFDGIYAAQLAPGTDPKFEVIAGGTWARPGDAGDFANSPYVYTIAVFGSGRVPANGYRRHFHNHELAKVEASFATFAPDSYELIKTDVIWPHSQFDGGQSWQGGAALRLDLPATRDEYYLTEDDVAFRDDVNILRDDAETQTLLLWTEGTRRTYADHERATRDENRGVFGPARPYITREGDTVMLSSQMFGVPHQFGLATGAYPMRLYRDGAQVPIDVQGGGPDGFTGLAYATLPPGPATYRLEIDATRTTPGILSPAASATWTFESAHTDEFQSIPVWVIAFYPELDRRNRAPRGWFEIPVRAGIGYEPPASVEKPRVEVSFDDGAHWHDAPVLGGSPDHWRVKLFHPPGPTHVSLRAWTRDGSGQRVDHTIIRAYRLD